ncbi:MAG TPA: GMC family oxidoreductase N-terminal domain-containing protein [Candidatus Udaeobacter sp.]|nr:GMC family oxidoreductase N-terminal domain-containing protein [Candidatus Udaeobacter sp.]
MKEVLVIGSGAGGATVAKDLQGDFHVTLLEAGRPFERLKLRVETFEEVRAMGAPMDPRLIRLIFPPMRVRKTHDMFLVNGRGVGGTTTIATGNGIRCDKDLQDLGIDLDAEFAQAYSEIPITTAHQAAWKESTVRLFEIAAAMGLNPRPTPKMGVAEHCAHCGRCELGCPTGAKWDSRRFVDAAVSHGADLRPSTTVERVVLEDGRATGVVARQGWRHRFFPADVVVVSAGGFGTPVVLESSGIACEPNLFVDPVLCVAGAVPGVHAYQEIMMPFVVQRDRYILSPYFDYLSFLKDPAWRRPAGDIVSVMVKVADDAHGHISGGHIQKTLTEGDRLRLDDGVRLATEIVERFGVSKSKTFLGVINAGHPGGMLPLTESSASSFHDDRLPANLYVADASLFPKALGNPPILTTVAMALRVSRVLRDRFLN